MLWLSIVPTWKTVYQYFRLWRLTGVWESMHANLRSQVRQARGRDAQPRATSIDRQSVKTTSVGGPARGYAGGKHVNGRKRQLVVNTYGFVVARKVYAAKSADRDGASLVLAGVAEQVPRIEQLWTDSGDHGRFHP